MKFGNDELYEKPWLEKGPKCQHSVQQKWVDAQMAKLLPFLYFLRQAFKNREFALLNDATKLSVKGNFLLFLDDLYTKDWGCLFQEAFQIPCPCG